MSDVSSKTGVTDLRVVTDLSVHTTAPDLVITLPVSPEEDALLRRLAQFERLGATLAPTMVLLKDEIRARDRRETIREPGEQWVSAS
ncbi:MAG: hypothetical protein QOE05_18 [Actinomycetota bacterium]|nr:hypothetical protein [Actinomycetota bacterium]